MTLESFRLDGKVVIITGGAGLLGREYSRAVCEAGGIPIVADLNLADAEAVAQGVGGEAMGIAVDVADKASVLAMTRRVLDRYGRIDGLVNNAAINPKFDAGETHLDTFEDFPLELWNQNLAVNITGMFLCAQAVAPTMLKQGSGVIINISSTYGISGPDQRLYIPDDPDQPRSFKPVTYTVSKAAAIGLTRYLATYYGDKGIRVVTLTPGGVHTNQDEDFVQRYSTRTPMGRMAEKHEYCGALIFLLSDASSYMTGSNLIVDGGWTAW